MRTLCGTIIAAAVAVGIGTASVAADDWKEIPLGSCRKVQGVSENMMGVCLDGICGDRPRKMPVFLAVGADVAACRNKVG